MIRLLIAFILISFFHAKTHHYQIKFMGINVAKVTMADHDTVYSSMPATIVKFSAQWKSSRPRFTVNFCADADKKTDMKDYYFIEFNTHTVQIGRTTDQHKSTFGIDSPDPALNTGLVPTNSAVTFSQSSWQALRIQSWWVLLR